MMAYEIGGLARSLAGHDKDDLFIIIQESKEYVYLVDGKYRTLEKPKCKKKKHLQPIHEKDETLTKKLRDGEHVTNEEIKYFIKCYKRRKTICQKQML